MAAAPRQIKPTKISLALDDTDAEADEPVEPFTFTLPPKFKDPKPFTLIDPKSVGWKELLDLENPYDLASICIEDPEEQERFIKADINGYLLGKITQGFRTHFGMGDQGKSRGSAS